MSPLPQATLSPLRDDGVYQTQGGRTTRWTVRSTQVVEYGVQMAPGVLAPADDTLIRSGATTSTRRLVVTDENVDSILGEAIRRYFDEWSSEYRIVTLPAGETHKSETTLRRLLAQIDGFGLRRRAEPVIAIGGGGVSDVVGFACSTYRRATPFVRVPTTLVGMIDAALGVKTGVNALGKKNRLGSYFPAVTTLIDLTLLRTLEPRHLSNGLAEIVKIAAVADRELFELVEDHGEALLTGTYYFPTSMTSGQARRDPSALIEAAITRVLRELQPNLWEHDLRRAMDFGHTFSPAVEMRALPELLHGEAVALDITLSAFLAHGRSLLDARSLDRILRLFAVLGLPLDHDVLSSDLLWAGLGESVAHRDGQQLVPLPSGIGRHIFVNDLTRGEVDEALAAMRTSSAVPRKPRVLPHSNDVESVEVTSACSTSS